jgi:hypothetical protein
MVVPVTTPAQVSDGGGSETMTLPWLSPAVSLDIAA